MRPVTDYKPFLDLVLEHATYDQGNLDHVGLKAVNPDFTSRDGFRWAFPGFWTRDDQATGEYTPDVCPTHPGDGLSVAKTAAGMAAGRYSPVTVLVVGFNRILAEDVDKWKVDEAKTLTVVDGIRLIRNDGTRADLSGANLSGADLYRANLSGAYLSGAYLSGANLSKADLSGANLYGADLSGADLSGADLSGADLSGAYLSGANLYRADLSGANLSGADLYRANLSGAYLSGANLSGANLSRADLSGHDKDGLRKRGAVL